MSYPQSNDPSPPHDHPPHGPPVQLEPEEKRVLAECEKESLIYRSIPLGLMALFATQYGMSTNMISTKSRFFKLGASLFAGYIIGKVSYAPACRQKILTQIPNSNLAYAIRGVETGHGINVDEHSAAVSSAHPTKDPSEAVVFLPDPVDPDTHSVPVGVNQYGDPIYETIK